MRFDPSRRRLGRWAGAAALAPWLASCGGDDASQSREADYSRAVESILTTYRPPGVLAGVHLAGEAPWTRAYGLSDVARATPMFLNSTFPIRSVTKSFTVTALLQLVQSGQLALDHKIERYVAGVPNGGLIDLADLAGNQSGLADYSMQPGFFEVFVKDTLRMWTTQELLAFSFAVQPPFLPGEQYQYSNTNTVLLGVVIEAVTRQSLGDVLAAQVFRPLGLNGTRYPSSPDLPLPAPTGYAVDVVTGVVDDQPLSARPRWRVPAPWRRRWPTCSSGARPWVVARFSVQTSRTCANRAPGSSPMVPSTTAMAWGSGRSATGGATPATASGSRSRP